MGFWGWVIVILVIVAVIGTMIHSWQEDSQQLNHAKSKGVSPADFAKWGALNDHMICPHCQAKGRILTKAIRQKKGVSGAKATGALLTGGVSLLATGLSRKEASTQAHCLTCNSTWHF